MRAAVILLLFTLSFHLNSQLATAAYSYQYLAHLADGMLVAVNGDGQEPAGHFHYEKIKGDSRLPDKTRVRVTWYSILSTGIPTVHTVTDNTFTYLGTTYRLVLFSGDVVSQKVNDKQRPDAEPKGKVEGRFIYQGTLRNKNEHNEKWAYVVWSTEYRSGTFTNGALYEVGLGHQIRALGAGGYISYKLMSWGLADEK